MTKSKTQRVIFPTLKPTEVKSRDNTPKYLHEREGLSKLVDEFCTKNGLSQTTDRRITSGGTIMSVRWVGKGDGIFYVRSGEQRENRIIGGDEPSRGYYTDYVYHFEGRYEKDEIKLKAEVTEVRSSQFMPETIELSSRREDKEGKRWWFVK